MWQKLEEWYAIKEAVGLSCFLGLQGAVYNLCRVRRDTDVVDILDRRTVSSKDDLMRCLRDWRELPIAVQMQGRGILLKEMPATEAVENEQILPVFPNYREDEYVFSYHGGLQNGWLALARTELLDRILTDLRREHMEVVRVFLGPFVADNVLDQLNGYSGHYAFDGHQITRDMEQKKWRSYSYLPAEKARFAVKVGGMDIAENYVIAYAAAFSVLMHRYVADVHVPYEPVDERLDEFRQKIRFKVNGLILLGGLFVLLLLNTVLFTYYKGKYEAIDYQAKENLSDVNETGRLVATVGGNDSLLVALGWNGGLRKSWLLNQLALSLAGKEGVDWHDVQISPVAVRRFGEKAETDSRYRIQVSGSCRTLNDLESWVRTLNHLNWIKQVEISRFVDQNKPNSTRKDFVVSMEYTYDF